MFFYKNGKAKRATLCHAKMGRGLAILPMHIRTRRLMARNGLRDLRYLSPNISRWRAITNFNKFLVTSVRAALGGLCSDGSADECASNGCSPGARRAGGSPGRDGRQSYRRLQGRGGLQKSSRVHCEE